MGPTRPEAAYGPVWFSRRFHTVILMCTGLCEGVNLLAANSEQAVLSAKQ
jgi:hypothetical protein